MKVCTTSYLCLCCLSVILKQVFQSAVRVQKPNSLPVLLLPCLIPIGTQFDEEIVQATKKEVFQEFTYLFLFKKKERQIKSKERQKNQKRDKKQKDKEKEKEQKDLTIKQIKKTQNKQTNKQKSIHIHKKKSQQLKIRQKTNKDKQNKSKSHLKNNVIQSCLLYALSLFQF
ncbi:hypothetical protein TTHERM_000241519 (macronuclear) [Tetrahymena thermophila SB210]|uniref:Transmembrane protein n=1 Tax=Tetrahymena thermophila (strain SB210) TaxID=312017 RepID=W7WY71_TETTS|nr:hypothetical protein TTHERM_000241519 [Tetrahymena thermophila SB210]EWS71790.1 hypothetical protein TTHERM_000241519 [Tetrahymena thermophila SB210]|eukprot:XP_012655677.1 hypothetical protein TTHERM_000241519 [Tetrahymena thermophila SB210]